MAKRNGKQFVSVLLIALMLCFNVFSDIGAMAVRADVVEANTEVTTIADVKEAANGTFTVKGTVTEVEGEQAVLADETGTITLRFMEAVSGIVAGDVITAEGTYQKENDEDVLMNVVESACEVEHAAQTTAAEPQEEEIATQAETGFDPITDDMMPEGALTTAAANAAASGTEATVVGQVVCKYGSKGTLNSIILEDVIDGEISGFQLFGKSYVDKFQIGDVVSVTGTISAYGNVNQISLNAEPTVIKEAAAVGGVIAPQELTIAELLAGKDAYLSEYVKVKDVTLGAYSTSNTTLKDATGTLKLYQGAAYAADLAEGDVADVYGVFSKYNTSYQLRNGLSTDYVKVSGSDTKNSVDESIVVDYAAWINGKDLGGATSFASQEGADQTAELTTIVNGEPAAPIFTTKGGTGTNYYLGATGLGSSDRAGYFQMTLHPEKKYGKFQIAMSMKGSGTTAKDWTLSYSTDGTTFSDVETFTLKAKATVYDFTAELPTAVNGAETVVLRLTPGATGISGNDTGAGGNFYLSPVKITASPVLSDAICAPVVIAPTSGEVMAGQELTLSCATEGAAITYSINGGNEAVYDENNKPVLTADMVVNGATVKAYATKEGKADSIVTTADYTQVQVATVKATPNGGSVAKGTEVKLSCETEGAVIRYSKDNGATWADCNGTIKLSSLPATYLVKAVKEGCKDSAAITCSYTERTNEKYNIYFGQLHSHTSYSDGAGTCEEAYQHASKVKNLDFLAVTDHSNSFDNADSSSIKDGSMSSEWVEGHQLADKYTTQNFVGIFGFEMTWSNGLGHMNTFNTDGFQSRTQKDYSTYATALQNYYATLKTVPDSISQFNHPGTTFGDFSDFAYYDEDIDPLITTIEVGNGEGAIGSSGYFPSYEYYQRALDKGWHVAPTNNQDNHKGLWGDANTGRSVVLADSLTRDNIYDAMRNYRVYATEDNDLNIYYTLDGYTMGTILEDGMTGDSVDLKVELGDATDKSIGKVQVITNGGLVLAEKRVSSNQETVSFKVDNDYSYYYIKVVEDDGDIAVTAPVWVGDVEAAGINSVSTTEVLPVKGESLPVNVELYNNEPSDMQINSIEFQVGDQTVHTVDLAKNDLTTLKSMTTASYSFDYTYDKVGSMELDVVVNATLNGVTKVYKSVLKLTYVSQEMVTKVVIDGTHYNDYVTGYYGGNMGNFAAIAGKKNIKVEVVKDKITPEVLKDCALLIVSAPAKKNGTANAGNYKTSHFDDEFLQTVKAYTDNGGALIACGIADYQDSTDCQTTTEMNKLLKTIGATTTLNSDEAYDTENNGGQPYRLYLTNCNKDSKYLKGAVEGQKYSAYSGCTVNVDADAVAAGKAEALVTGFDTTYSIDSKNADGSRGDSSTYVQKGNVVAMAHETLDSGANIFVSGTVFVSDFEVKAELDNIWDVPYLNRTIAENILDEVTVKLPATSIAEVRKADMGDVFAIEGYVTAGTSVEGNTFFDTIYVQDETGGITVFPYSESGLEIGTKVRITGYVDAYQGDKELQVISSEVLEDEAPYVYTPEKMSAKDAMNYSKSGGRLVQVQGKVVDALYDASGTGVSQLWLDDGSGDIANVFIDGYIFSGTTGKNELASFVKKGNTVSAVGLVYAHPEGTSDEAVICLRVRNLDEIKLVEAASEDKPSDDNKPSDDDKPSDDGKPSDKATGSVTTTTTVSGELIVNADADWNTVTEKLAQIKEGETLEVSLVGTTKVSGKALESIKGTSKTIVLKLPNGVRWKINGKKITGTNLADLDLGVTLNTDVIPAKLVSDVAKNGNGYLEISLAHDGQFGFEATMTIPLGKEYAGQFANLYYYNVSTGKMELMGSYPINANGEADLVFTHASDYVIVMDNVAHTQKTATDTGDSTNVVGIILLLVAGAMLVALAYRRKLLK